MLASVVVPTFNRREIVLRTVDTLLRQDFPAANYEIIVVVMVLPTAQARP